jgi:hypothetical protein
MTPDMRVDYTVPGWEPETSGISSPSTSENAPVSFSQVLEQLTESVPVSAQSLLGLDTPPPSQFTLPPPPAPDSLNGLDAPALRSRWDSLMANHQGEPETEGMMSLLSQFQTADNGIASRVVMEAKG